MLKNLKKKYFLLISTFLILYFFFNLMSGERGMISNLEKKRILQNLKNEEIKLENKIKELEFNNSLISDNLDLDYVETLIRQRFLFGKENEKIFIIQTYDTKN